MLSAPIIYLFSGKEYMPTSPVLKIFAIYMIVSAFLSILNHQVFFINGKERKSVYLFFLFGIVNTLAVWILGSSITPEYAILTTCVSQALLTVVMAIYARRNLGVFCELFNLQVVKYLVCSLIVVPIVLISCWIMDSYYLQLALSIPISIIAYSGILLMLKDDAILELIRKVPFIGHKGASGRGNLLPGFVDDSHGNYFLLWSLPAVCQIQNTGAYRLRRVNCHAWQSGL